VNQANEHDPHAAQEVFSIGPAPEDASATLIMLHGRGATATSILEFGSELGIESLAMLAPQAADLTWYPHSFLAPIEANQPFLDSALRKIEAIVAELLSRGVPPGQLAFLGFSQGACLTTEFVARHPRRYGAVMALTGGLMGPPGITRAHNGALGGTLVFLGTGDPDPHVPYVRVQETADILRGMGSDVELRRYPGMPHTVNQDEMEICCALLNKITPGHRGNGT
jgi:phospholipase/carboxylesterase